MNPGALKTRGWLQSPGTSQDALGQPVESWTNVALAWANVRYQSGTETIKAAALTAVVQASVRIRSRTGVNAGMRYLVGANAFNIKSAPPFDSSKPYMDLVCEVVNVQS